MSTNNLNFLELDTLLNDEKELEEANGYQTTELI
jgi:hypothetical protein